MLKFNLTGCRSGMNGPLISHQESCLLSWHWPNAAYAAYAYMHVHVQTLAPVSNYIEWTRQLSTYDCTVQCQWHMYS